MAMCIGSRSLPILWHGGCAAFERFKGHHRYHSVGTLPAGITVSVIVHWIRLLTSFRTCTLADFTTTQRTVRCMCRAASQAGQERASQRLRWRLSRLRGLTFTEQRGTLMASRCVSVRDMLRDGHHGGSVLLGSVEAQVCFREDRSHKGTAKEVTVRRCGVDAGHKLRRANK